MKKDSLTFITSLVSFALGLGVGIRGSSTDLFAYVTIYSISYVAGEIIGYKMRSG